MTKVFPWFVHAQSYRDVQACSISCQESTRTMHGSVLHSMPIFLIGQSTVIRFQYEMPEEAPSANHAYFFEHINMTTREFLWCKKRETHLEFGKLYKKKWKQKIETFAAILSAWMLAGYIPMIWSYDSAAFGYSPSSQYNKARSNLRPTSFGSAVIAFLRQYLIWPVFFCSLHWQNNVSMWRAGHKVIQHQIDYKYELG